jgi:hypothetical protein
LNHKGTEDTKRVFGERKERNEGDKKGRKPVLFRIDA